MCLEQFTNQHIDTQTHPIPQNRNHIEQLQVGVHELQ